MASVSGYTKERANDLLRWFLREILYSDTWKRRPHYKIILGQVIAEELFSYGFKWQGNRVLNHIHKFKLKQKISLDVSCRIRKDPDTPLRKEGESS